MSPTQRAAILYKLAEIIEANKEEIGRIESLDSGKPLLGAINYDVMQTVNIFRYYAGWVDKIHGKTIPMEDGFFCYTSHEPIGVVGAIVPWNYPLMLAAWKVAPALAVGCTVVLKPAEFTPLSALLLGEYAVRAGLPPGVLNVVPGYGPTAGHALASHLLVDKIAFTGSTQTGRSILHAAANSNLKRVSLELGGKSPNILFDDADLERAIPEVTMALFVNMGENCCAGSRLFIQESIYDKVVPKIVECAKNIVVGDPMKPETVNGPLIDESHLKKVLDYIEAGKRQGAKLLCGGYRIGERGYFVAPTVFGDVQPEMSIATDEIFGPVLSIIKFKDLDDAVSKANKSIYGLAAAVWTKDMTKAHQIAKRVSAGVVWINTYNIVKYNAPFGGTKYTGTGRDLGKYALAEYTNVKTVLSKL